MTDTIETVIDNPENKLLVNEYPENLRRIDGDLVKIFGERAGRALQIHGMKERQVRVAGYEWATTCRGYDASELRQMCNGPEVERVAKSMIAAFNENTQGIQGYEFINYLRDGTLSFPEIPADGIVPDQSAIVLIGEHKKNPSVAIGLLYNELKVPYMQLFADIAPVKSNRIFQVFPADGKPIFTRLEEGFPNNLHFQMRGVRSPELHRNIEEATEEFSGPANAIQGIYHNFSRVYAATPLDFSKIKLPKGGERR